MSDLFTSEALMFSVGLLILRLGLAGSLLVHGIPKILNFSELRETFPDPLGTGRTMALLLAIFSEVFCALFVLSGLWMRAALIPLIGTFIVITFVVHCGKVFSDRELGWLYLIGFTALFFTGAGDFALTF